MESTAARHDRKKIWSWAFYDWANSAFATVVLAGFFPLLFQDFWSSDATPEQANLRLGWVNAAASFFSSHSARHLSVRWPMARVHIRGC